SRRRSISATRPIPRRNIAERVSGLLGGSGDRSYGRHAADAGALSRRPRRRSAGAHSDTLAWAERPQGWGMWRVYWEPAGSWAARETPSCVSGWTCRTVNTSQQPVRRAWSHDVAAARPSLCLAVLPVDYTPRATTNTVLHQVVRAHLDRFLAETVAATDGVGLPRFIERELRDFLGCGQLERGFARVRCNTCRFERLLPFSCKTRAICPSCGGRRMAEQAAHLVDAVLPWVPVRQWVLTSPHTQTILWVAFPLLRGAGGAHEN